ncbi:hypothetical protein ATK30_7087 [Amycolatopsis echigonensis]|uniref:Uncharacterized protein n=1 Tax=Amycolatopsis echigonensis TaxID=2576905 RepID=A0A2N3WQM8_9PSEU|nr:hypothetical protein ATK30_7087 [Amycolatopsis niigatensis]
MTGARGHVATGVLELLAVAWRARTGASRR